MNTTIHWITIFVTYFTVIASYYTMMSIFDFEFVKKPLYSKIKYVLWIATALMWIIDIVVLKSCLTSDIAIGTQFIIQLVLNAVFVALPMAIFALIVNIRLTMIAKKEKRENKV